VAVAHYRCPLCGKLSKPENFDIHDGEHNPGDDDGEHSLDLVTQHFVGRGQGGFQWDRKPAPREVVHALWEATRAAYERLSAELGIPPWGDDDE